jgi:hypothetical protein
MTKEELIAQTQGLTGKKFIKHFTATGPKNIKIWTGDWVWGYAKPPFSTVQEHDIVREEGMSLFLPKALVDLGLFKSNNDVKRARPDLFVELAPCDPCLVLFIADQMNTHIDNHLVYVW